MQYLYMHIGSMCMLATYLHTYTIIIIQVLYTYIHGHMTPTSDSKLKQLTCSDTELGQSYNMSVSDSQIEIVQMNSTKSLTKFTCSCCNGSWREGGEGGREGGKEGGKEGGREGGREGEREREPMVHLL